MKPEPWIIEDIGNLRRNKNRTEKEDQYLALLMWYVQEALKTTDSQRKMLKVAAERGKELETSGPLAGAMNDK